MKINNKLIAKHLSAGGDDRIKLDKNGRNKYGISGFPEKMLNFGSTTINPVSELDFLVANSVLKSIEGRDGASYTVYNSIMQDIRDGLRRCLDLDDDVDIALGPSGTDMEMLASVLSAQGGNLLSLIALPDEIGSGSVLASSCKYFSKETPDGKSVIVGAGISGFDEKNIQIITFGRNEIATDVLLNDAVSRAIDGGSRVLVHLVHGSKLNSIWPDPNGLLDMANEYEGSVDVVVDACQGRISNNALNEYLKKNWMVIYTGSKFIGGMAYSGALLVPSGIRSKMVAGNKNQIKLPVGLSNFFDRGMMPYRWTVCDRYLQPRMNVGLAMRWALALNKLEKFKAIGAKRFILVSNIFQNVYKNVIGNYENFLPQLEMSFAPLNNDDREDLAHRGTVQAFALQSNGEKLSFELVKDFHNYILKRANETDVGEKFMLGQPVRVGAESSGVLRIGLSAEKVISLSGMTETRISDVLRSELDYILEQVNKFYIEWLDL
jgi:hypothetical protein